MDPVTLSKAKRYAESLIGDSVGMELRQSGGNIEWRQSGGEWAVLIPVNDLLGPGVPPGGDTGQVLSKASGTSGDTEWATPFDGDYDSLSNKPVLGSAAAEDANAFASADHAHGLGDLTDVDLSGIATGETIVWDGGGFTPGAASGGDMLKADYDSVGNGVVNEARAVLWDGVTNRPSEFPPSNHSHPASEITGLQGLLDDKANVVSGSGTRVPTFTGGTQDSGGVALDTDATAGTVALRGAGGVVSVGAPTSPAHAATKKYVDDTVGNAGGGDMLKSEYDSVGDGVVNEARAVAWAGVTDKPSTFTPSPHNHGMSDVTGLADALDGKANATHSHGQSDITGLTDALSGKADTSHQHSAGDITSGTLSVARGGTGATSFTSGSFLQGSGTGALTTRTPAQVLGDIGAAAASHTHAVSDVTGLQAAILEPFYINPQGNGAVEIVFDSLTALDLSAVRVRGTGTLAYEKSTDGATFATVTGATAFAAGDVLRINVTDYDSYLTLAIPRLSPAAAPDPGWNSALWTADFETGDTLALDSTATDGTGTITVDGVRTRRGSYAVALTADFGQAGSQGCFLHKGRSESGANPDGLYYSAWFYLPAPVATPSDTLTIWQYQSKGASDPYATNTWSLELAQDGDHMVLLARDRTAGTVINHAQSAPIPFPTGEWVHIETFLKPHDSGDGAFSVWQNDTQLFDFTSATTTRPGSLDNRWSVRAYGADIGSGPTTLYVDDMALSTSPLGAI